MKNQIQINVKKKISEDSLFQYNNLQSKYINPVLFKNPLYGLLNISYWKETLIMHPCQNELLKNYKSSSDFKDEPDAWRMYKCIIKNKTIQIRNDRDLSKEVLFKFCNECNFI